jgi:hypothetical protein
MRCCTGSLTGQSAQVEGARLAALARGEPPPLPQDDPDIREVVADALAGELAVAAFELGQGDADHDLLIGLVLTPDGASLDLGELAGRVGDAVMAILGGRLRRGVGIWFGAPPADLPASPGGRLASLGSQCVAARI